MNPSQLSTDPNIRAEEVYPCAHTGMDSPRFGTWAQKDPDSMVNAVTDVETVRHAGFGPGEFPSRWRAAAFDLHCNAWPSVWEGQLDRERFNDELDSDHVDVLYEPNGDAAGGTLLAYVKWKATENFLISRDDLSEPGLISLSEAPPAGYICAYEITASTDPAYRGLGRRLLEDTLGHWEQHHGQAVFCTYSPKRKLTATLRRLAETEQYGRPSLEALAHRAGAVASRRIQGWIERMEQPLESFIRNELVPVPDDRIMHHLNSLKDRYGEDLVDGVVAAIGVAYNFVLNARSGRPACGPAAFHRALGAEHWRQYPASAANCADALGLVDHWRYSHDPKRRNTCATIFRERCASSAQPDAEVEQLLVLA